MKIKILGSIVCMLLIAAAVLPLARTMNVGKSIYFENNNLEDKVVISIVCQFDGRTDDYDWQVSGNNLITLHE